MIAQLNVRPAGSGIVASVDDAYDPTPVGDFLMVDITNKNVDAHVRWFSKWAHGLRAAARANFVPRIRRWLPSSASADAAIPMHCGGAPLF